MDTLAAYISALGPAECIQVGDLPVATPGPTDVLVRTEAMVVDNVDTLVRSGAYSTPTPFPFIIGRDLVGTVASAGPGATGFSEGDRVWCNSLGHAGRQGSFAHHVVVAAERLYHLPADVDPIRARMSSRLLPTAMPSGAGPAGPGRCSTTGTRISWRSSAMLRRAEPTSTGTPQGTLTCPRSLRCSQSAPRSSLLPQVIQLSASRRAQQEAGRFSGRIVVLP